MREEMSLQVESMATYRIRVQGELGEEWSVRFHNLVISVEATDTDELPVTILTGQLPDQDGLRQVVNTLYDQRLPLLSLEYLEEDETQNWQRLIDKDHLSDNA